MELTRARFTQGAPLLERSECVAAKIAASVNSSRDDQVAGGVALADDAAVAAAVALAAGGSGADEGALAGGSAVTIPRRPK